MKTILVIAALREEFEAFKNVFKIDSESIENYSNMIVAIKEYENYKIVGVRQTFMGSVVSSIFTYKCIQIFKPDVIFLAGIAGGIESNNVQLGDVIISSSVIDCTQVKYKHEVEKKFFNEQDTMSIHSALGKDEFQINAKSYEMHTSFINSLDIYIESLREKENKDNKSRENAVLEELKDKISYSAYGHLQDYLQSKKQKYKIGAIACVTGVVTNQNMLQKILVIEKDCLAIEMESGGVYRAINTYDSDFNIPFIVCKGISDLCNSEKNLSSKECYRILANYSSMVFIKNLLNEKNILRTRFKNTISDNEIEFYELLPTRASMGSDYIHKALREAKKNMTLLLGNRYDFIHNIFNWHNLRHDELIEFINLLTIEILEEKFESLEKIISSFKKIFEVQIIEDLVVLIRLAENKLDLEEYESLVKLMLIQDETEDVIKKLHKFTKNMLNLEEIQDLMKTLKIEKTTEEEIKKKQKEDLGFIGKYLKIRKYLQYIIPAEIKICIYIPEKKDKIENKSQTQICIGTQSCSIDINDISKIFKYLNKSSNFDIIEYKSDIFWEYILIDNDSLYVTCNPDDRNGQVHSDVFYVKDKYNSKIFRMHLENLNFIIKSININKNKEAIEK